jgi:hypothetical protein
MEWDAYPQFSGYCRDDALRQYLIQRLLSIVSGFLKLFREVLPLFESDTDLFTMKRGNIKRLN